jgi:AmmeMemoRadiSam system protein A
MSPDPIDPAVSRLSAEEQQLLLKLARRSIQHGLEEHEPLQCWSNEQHPFMNDWLSCFVTLFVKGKLHGCIGTVEPHRPLGEDVCQNAYAAAFRDPRFPPLSSRELKRLTIKISILSAPESFPVDSELDLIQRLRPGVDGLILSDGYHRGLFLPSVWEQLPEPRTFLRQLRRKAGLSQDHWSSTQEFQRFDTYEFGDD